MKTLHCPFKQGEISAKLNQFSVLRKSVSLRDTIFLFKTPFVRVYYKNPFDRLKICLTNATNGFPVLSE